MLFFIINLLNFISSANPTAETDDEKFKPLLDDLNRITPKVNGLMQETKNKSNFMSKLDKEIEMATKEIESKKIELNNIKNIFDKDASTLEPLELLKRKNEIEEKENEIEHLEEMNEAKKEESKRFLSEWMDDFLQKRKTVLK